MYVLLQIKCYHKSDITSEREVVFRLQFHTGAVQGYNLMFEKEDMETANKGRPDKALRSRSQRAAASLWQFLCSTQVLQGSVLDFIQTWHFETSNFVFPNMLRVQRESYSQPTLFIFPFLSGHTNGIPVYLHSRSQICRLW